MGSLFNRILQDISSGNVDLFYYYQRYEHFPRFHQTIEEKKNKTNQLSPIILIYKSNSRTRCFWLALNVRKRSLTRHFIFWLKPCRCRFFFFFNSVLHKLMKTFLWVVFSFKKTGKRNHISSVCLECWWQFHLLSSRVCVCVFFLLGNCSHLLIVCLHARLISFSLSAWWNKRLFYYSNDSQSDLNDDTLLIYFEEKKKIHFHK